MALDWVDSWAPWPRGEAPQISVLEALGPESPLCALLGSGSGAERGRLGLVGVPRRIESLSPGPGAIARAVDQRPGQGIRVLLLGYEMGGPEVFLEPLAPPRGQPAGVLLDLDSALIVDHHRERWSLVGPDRDGLVDLIEARGRGPGPKPGPAPGPAGSPMARGWPKGSLVPETPDPEHGDRIRRALAAIGAGEIYQANISRRLCPAPGQTLDPVQAVRALYELNPVAHAALVRIPGLEVLSNSMETLLAYDPHRGQAESFPIKGTRGRGAGNGTGGADLAQDAKERAEHVMIVDLVRNDLGRVCVPGSVSVPELMGTYGFRGVWHGISTVRGTLSPDHTPGELLAALFPGGSITGAPKRRAVEIIRGIEGEPRGFYSGSIVLILPDGRISASILIRTAVRDAGGWSLPVGGGIVADSVPGREIEETWEKVAVFQQWLAAARPAAPPLAQHQVRPRANP